VTPERLELVAFGPFVAPQVVDLARAGAHGLFLIHGPTGSGKSTLLDALTFALFGETSGSDRDGSDLVATLADGAEARVTLTFAHGGARYRVTRTPRQRRRKRRGDGFTEVAPTAALHRLEPDGGERLLVDGAREVTARVEALLKCDAVQFRQTVVLPQGQFRRVIEDDETRARTLADLFDTGRFARLQLQLKTYAAHLRRQVQALLDELGALREAHAVPDAAGMAALVDAAAAQHQATVATAREADAAHAAAIEARSEARAWAERFAALAEARDALARLAAEAANVDADRARLVADRAARDAEPAVRAWQQAEEDAATRAKAQQEAQRAVDAARQALAEANAARDGHAEARPERDAAADVVGRLAPLAGDVARLSDARGADERAQSQADAATAATEVLEGERAKASDVLQAADAEATALEPVAAGLGEAAAAARTADTALAAFDALEAARRSLVGAAAPSGPDLQALWGPLARALASRLEPGAPCPVCGAMDHPAAAHARDPAAALAEAEAALHAAQAAGTRELEARVRAEERAAAALAAGGWEAGAVPERGALEAALAAAAATHEDAKRAADRLAACRAARESARTRLTDLDVRLIEARAAQAAAREAAAAAGAALTALLERLDPAHHEPATFEAALTEARATVDAFDRRAEALAKAALETAHAAALAEERLQAAAREAAEATTRLERALAEAEAALREAGFVRAEDDARAEGEAFAEGEALVADPAAQAAALLPPDLRTALDARVRGHDESVAAQTHRRDALVTAIGDRTPPDLEALESAVAAAQAQRDAAAAERDAARDALAALATAHERWSELEARLGTDEARQRTAQHLAELVNGTAKGHSKLDLESYVLRRILSDVLRHANTHLARMTGGRYQLRLRDRSDELRARGLELDVEDRHAGGARRRVATLSGGEGFQASLALALGLSEAAERTSGAVELGALFIDEGFGSLDAHALDGVVRILRELPQRQRRMVGVITHVDELKRRIEAQVSVVRNGLESRVEQRG